MNERLLRLYSLLPPAARSMAASARGVYLRTWRYGPETDRLVAEAQEREHWSEAQWRSWQEERLAQVLHRAALRVPYYREHWAARRRRGDRASWELLENWPILEKEAVRENPLAFVADDCRVRAMYRDNTSGTSGTPLDLWLSRATVRAWYALFETRWRRWYGVSRHHRWANLGGQLVVPVARRRPPYWVWNAGLNQLYLSSYHLAPACIPAYLDALQRYRITFVLAYTSSLYALAEEAVRLGRRDVRLAVAVMNAEPVLEHQRKMIMRAFRCPVRETYGMAEIVTAASECEAGRLHLWPEVGWTEVMGPDGYVERGQVGELVCTGLLNVDMPLVRYRVGDRGALLATSEVCACGRTLPALAAIEGRVDDVLYTRDGRPVGRLDPVFKTHVPIREAQIIQDALDRVRVRYVPAPEFTPADGQSIVERLQARMGPVRVMLEETGSIARTPGGKFRAVICNIPSEERQRFLRR